MYINGINYANFLFSYQNSAQKSGLIEQLSNKYSNYVNISTFGQSLNNIYNDLKNIDDEKKREEALKGARNIIISLSKTSDGTELAKFKNSLSSLKKDNLETFNNLFVEANELNSLHYDIGGWIKSFSNLYETGYQKEYVDKTDKIMNTEGDGSQKILTLDKFVNGVGSISDMNVSDDKLKEDALSNFFKGLNNYTNLSDINNFIDTYTNNITKGTV